MHKRRAVGETFDWWIPSSLGYSMKTTVALGFLATLISQVSVVLGVSEWGQVRFPILQAVYSCD